MSSSCPKVATITYCLTANANACLWVRRSITFCSTLPCCFCQGCLFLRLFGWIEYELNYVAKSKHPPVIVIRHIPCLTRYPLPFVRSAFPPWRWKNMANTFRTLHCSRIVVAHSRHFFLPIQSNLERIKVDIQMLSSSREKFCSLPTTRNPNLSQKFEKEILPLPQFMPQFFEGPKVLASSLVQCAAPRDHPEMMPATIFAVLDTPSI